MLFIDKIKLHNNNFLLLVVLEDGKGQHHVYLETSGENYKKLESFQISKKAVTLSEYGKIIIQGKGREPTDVEKYYIKEKYKL